MQTTVESSTPLTLSHESAEAAIAFAQAELDRAEAAAREAGTSSEPARQHAAAERVRAARELLAAIKAATDSRVA